MGTGYLKTLLSLGLLLSFQGNAFAQDDSKANTLNQAKIEVEQLYQQWRLANPHDVISSRAFWLYLNQSQSLSKGLPLGYNSFAERLEPITGHLPSGGWIISTYMPTSNHLMGFYVDLNGSKLPNGHLFGDTSDQFQLEMDNNGHIGP